jgi:uncharacterized protein (TIGR02145 family)
MKHFTKISKFAAMVAIAAIGFSLYACEEKEKASKPTEAAVPKEMQKPAVETGTFTDARDKKTYRTVKIGKQVWMAENLNYGVSMCFDHDESNCEKYGGLYYWDDAMTACPSGWHLPSEEWDALIVAVGGKETAGKHLKAKSGWNDDDGKSGNGLDTYGFAALPGGDGVDDGNINAAGYGGIWWSAIKSNANDIYGWRISHNYDNIFKDSFKKGESILLSVRCIKD